MDAKLTHTDEASRASSTVPKRKLRTFPAETEWHHRYEEYSKASQKLNRLSPLLFYPLTLIVFSIDSLGSGIPHHETIKWVSVGLLAIPLVLTIASIKGKISKSKANKADFALVEDPQEQVWLVEILIHAWPMQMGRDRGVVGFQNGALFFNGRCCSFQIGPQDVDQDGPYKRTRLASGGIRHDVQFWTRPGPRTLSFRLLKHSAWNMKEKERAFSERLTAFVEGLPTAEPRSLPPSEPPSKTLAEWHA